ncbi:MAG TPA: response regulator [Nitrospiraceae bacterium]|jgi:DNA-binding NtrC family response regulator|nr:response regulator [Nitrospiraceae bacterium]
MDRILVIDDDPMALATFELILRMEKGPGVVETARTAEAALLFTAGMTFDAILSDIRMPDYDGIDFLREIKATHRNMPVILVTGDDNWDLEYLAFHYGAFALLKKPIQPTALLMTINKALELNRVD